MPSGAWWSDFPGAYIENIEIDDSRKTWAVGTDQGENLTPGRMYSSGIWLNTPGYTGAARIGLYGQVDLDMLTNGDAGFFVDQSCCERSMLIGQWWSW